MKVKRPPNIESNFLNFHVLDGTAWTFVIIYRLRVNRKSFKHKSFGSSKGILTKFVHIYPLINGISNFPPVFLPFSPFHLSSSSCRQSNRSSSAKYFQRIARKKLPHQKLQTVNYIKIFIASLINYVLIGFTMFVSILFLLLLFLLFVVSCCYVSFRLVQVRPTKSSWTTSGFGAKFPPRVHRRK